MSIEFLTVEEVESFHDDQLERHGGLAGVRDRAGLESAVATVQSTFGGQFLHGTVFEMAAAYAFHLSENQPFVDGNKRTALNAAVVFLGLNGWDVDEPDEKLYAGMLGISSGTVSKADFAKILEDLSRPYVDDDQ
jgi:death-on-curing protein